MIAATSEPVHAPVIGSGIPTKSATPQNEYFSIEARFFSTFPRRKFAHLLKNLNLDYIDCMLIHWPIPTGHHHDYQTLNAQTFEVMEKYRQKGLIRYTGVSNFLPSHIDELYSNTSLIPCINQVEMHAGLKQEEIIKYCNDKNILVSAWRPLVKGACASDETLVKIANDINRTPAQVALRYIVEKGCIPIPKSVTKSRIEENFDIFSFSLTSEQMQKIDNMKENRVGSHPLTLNK